MFSNGVLLGLPISELAYGADSLFINYTIIEKDCTNILNKLPISSSNLYSKNLFNFVNNLYDKENNNFKINLEDEIIKNTLIK